MLFKFIYSQKKKNNRFSNGSSLSLWNEEFLEITISTEIFKYLIPQNQWKIVRLLRQNEILSPKRRSERSYSNEPAEDSFSSQSTAPAPTSTKPSSINNAKELEDQIKEIVKDIQTLRESLHPNGDRQKGTNYDFQLKSLEEGFSRNLERLDDKWTREQAIIS